MRLFLYEYTCAAGGKHDGSASLSMEGAAMLRAIVEDFSRLPNVEIATLLADCFPEDLGDRCQHVTPEQEPAAFRELAAWAHFTLVIAPEFDDLLATRCRWVIHAGGRLLGPSPEAVALTADKLSLAGHLQRHGIPTPPTRLLDTFSPPTLPVVCKPRHGAGSQATFLIRTPAEWDEAVQTARREMPDGDFVVQPYCRGLPASVACLIGPTHAVPLLPVAQHLSTDGRCRYLGGSLPLPREFAERVVPLGLHAVQAVAGLRGYVGVDLVLGDEPDGSADRVLEINPRLTTSYLGLRHLAESNLAEAMLRVVQSEETASLRWRGGAVRFHPDGWVEPE